MKEYPRKTNTQVVAELYAHVEKRKRKALKRLEKRKRIRHKKGGGHVSIWRADKDDFYRSPIWREVRYDALRKARHYVLT